jgi:hypothetical protein
VEGKAQDVVLQYFYNAGRIDAANPEDGAKHAEVRFRKYRAALGGAQARVI